MNQCTKCRSYAMNEHPESGLCDVCYWKVRAERHERGMQRLMALYKNTGRLRTVAAKQIQALLDGGDFAPVKT